MEIVNKVKKQQHGYVIYETDSGNVVKTGISGQPLNQNRSSPRANRQVNAFNRAEGEGKYAATVVKPSIPNRAEVLEWEIEYSMELWNNKNTMSRHKRPRPWEKSERMLNLWSLNLIFHLKSLRMKF